MRWGSYGEGSSSGVQPSDSGFDWQDNSSLPPDSPDVMQQHGLWRASTPSAATLSQAPSAVAGRTPSSPDATVPDWRAKMRKALHNQNLEINSLEPSYASNPRLFIAFDSKNPEDRHAKTFDPSQPLPPSHSAPVTSGNLHFIQGFAKPTKIKLRELPWVNPVFRRLIYLDSQSNMDYISNEYFGGHMRFLPIDVEQL